MGKMVRKGFLGDISKKTDESSEMRRNGAQRSLKEVCEVDEGLAVGASLCVQGDGVR